VKPAGRRSTRFWIYAGSLAAHLAFWGIIMLLPAPERSNVIAIDFGTVKKKTEPPKPPPAPPPPPEVSPPKPPPQALAAPPPKAAEEPPKEAPRRAEVGVDGFADLRGVSLGADGGVAADAGAAPSASRVEVAPVPKAIAHRVKQLEAPAREACAEPAVKPKVKTPGQVTYTKEGQEAEIEGAVRVQVTVDETGKVVAASVLTGLGYGLDERALAAAQETVFEPGTLCGTPVVATKVLAFNFELR
jgi:protein TonB